MNKRMILGASLISLVALVLLIAGCGGSDESASQAESAAPAEEVAPAETAAETATETVAAHDCAGGCGMTAVSEDKMTEIDGKWYCAGCAKKAQAEHEGHGEG
jgi:anaerobic selenocysteine-containing dehydrogenase